MHKKTPDPFYQRQDQMKLRSRVIILLAARQHSTQLLGGGIRQWP